MKRLNRRQESLTQINKIGRKFVGEGLAPPARIRLSFMPIGVTRMDAIFGVRFLCDPVYKTASGTWLFSAEGSKPSAARRILFIALFAALFLYALPALAQENAVTDDDVNAVAEQLYCPVCENIPLDVCPTDACIQWRREIRVQLEAGQSPDQIIADFVRRFGDRVVGTPQDPTLRAISLATPVLLALAALVVAGAMLRRRMRGAAQPMPVTVAGEKDDEFYRARLEADLRERR
jgi:cytochrome c-type biogenesis protein CcmH